MVFIVLSFVSLGLYYLMQMSMLKDALRVLMQQITLEEANKRSRVSIVLSLVMLVLQIGILVPIFFSEKYVD